MNISVIIGIMLVAQVSASFVDTFQGAVSSVQNSFGKLFSDVVTDVKETVDCTILAVEHVLSLSPDATERYHKKCGTKNASESDAQSKAPMLEIIFGNNDQFFKRELLQEIDARLNGKLFNFLNGYNPHDKLADVERELASETVRLASVNHLVRQELDRLSNEIHIDFAKIERRGSKPSVDIIFDELKVLEAIEQNIRNSTEANEIHRLIDNALNKLHDIESSEATQNIKVDEILKDLERTENGKYKDMRQRLEAWKLEEARLLDAIKNKVTEHEQLPEHYEYLKRQNTRGNEPSNSAISNTVIENRASVTEISTKSSILSVTLSKILTATSRNTELTVLTAKQFSSVPKIITIQSASSSKQINDGSETITPVAISTSSFVNKTEVTVTEKLNPQTIKKEQAFDHNSNATLEIIKPYVVSERKDLLSESVPSFPYANPSIVPPIKSKKSPIITSDIRTIPLGIRLESFTKSSVSPSELILNKKNTYPKTTIGSASTSQVMSTKLPERTPKPTTNSLVTTPELFANSSVTTLEPIASSTETSSELTTNHSVITLEPTTSFVVVSPEPIMRPSEPTTRPQITTSKFAASSLVITSQPAISLPVTTSELTTGPLITTPEPAISSSVTASNSITSTLVAAPKPSMSLPMRTSESTTSSPVSTPEPSASPLATTPKSMTRLPITASESAASSLVTTSESTTNPPVTTREPTTNPPVITSEPTTSPPITTTDLAQSSLVSTSESIMSPTITTPEATVSTSKITAEPITSDTELTVNSSMKNLELTTSPSIITSELTTSPPVTTSEAPENTPEINPQSTPEPTESVPEMTSERYESLQETTLGALSSLPETISERSESLQKTTPEPFSSIPGTTPKPRIVSELDSFLATNADKGVLHIPGYKPAVPPPSLQAIHNFKDRKEGFTRPSPMKDNHAPHFLKPFHTPLLYALGQNSPNKRESHTPHRHLPHHNINPLLVEPNPLIPGNEAVPLLTGLVNPSNQHRPLRSLPSKKPYNKRPLNDRNNSNGAPIRRERPPPRLPDFFNSPAFLDAQKLIEDRQVMRNILKKKRKGKSAFDFSAPLNIGK